MEAVVGRLLGVILLGAFIVGCSSTEELDHTEMGAVSGTVVGAGLGAIVGSATGNTAGGLAIGAAAGAVAGAGTGYQVQQREDRIDAQDDLIQAREKQIDANRAQIDSLKAMSSERIAFAGEPGSSVRQQLPPGVPSSYQPPVRQGFPKSEVAFDQPRAAVATSAGVVEKNLVDSSAATIVETSPPPPVEETVGHEAAEPLDSGQPAEEMAEVSGVEDGSASIEEGEPAQESPQEPTQVAKLIQPSSLAGAEQRAQTPECKQAVEEAKEGDQADDISDKLFHVRRALRLCPAEPDYHNRLGELYVSLDRTSDAEFEFQQALQLHPDHESAKANLDNLRKY